LRERSKIKAQKTLAMKIREDQTLRLSNDPVQFFRQIVGFEPTRYQKDFIKPFVENQFTAGRRCRRARGTLNQKKTPTKKQKRREKRELCGRNRHCGLK
jgi:hypothetical protein